uniref:Small ribosomal subunit protein eS21 n=1 Tax=Sarcophilus harrisii TaxID=9305 RepID=G3WKL3_SARHA
RPEGLIVFLFGKRGTRDVVRRLRTSSPRCAPEVLPATPPPTPLSRAWESAAFFSSSAAFGFALGKSFLCSSKTLLSSRLPPGPSAADMQNDAGEFVDLYVPRKCSASNRIIGAKDHASIQMNVAEVDKVTGRFNGQFKTYAICGAIRRMGESDDSILRLAKNDGIVSKNF